MAWVSGFVRYTKTSENQRLFQGDIVLKKVEDVILHGTITEADGKGPVPGALVKVFAQSADGREIALGHSYTGEDGHYLLAVNKNKIPAGTAAIYVRAVAKSSLSG
ncbi:MAG: hypothetical protein ACOY46_05855 [Bacillota bacterium]